MRVGGGFLSIDEFLDQYTPTEMSKVDRKSPIKRMNERIGMLSTLQEADASHNVNNPNNSSVASVN